MLAYRRKYFAQELFKILRSTADGARCSTKPGSKCLRLSKIEGAADALHHMPARARVKIPIARGTATLHLTPRFRALALFGRRPPQRVDRPSSRRPKTCTTAEFV